MLFQPIIEIVEKPLYLSPAARVLQFEPPALYYQQHNWAMYLHNTAFPSQATIPIARIY